MESFIRVIVCLLILMLLVGCTGGFRNDAQIAKDEEDHKIIGTFESVKIIKKERYLKPLRYVIFVKKNNQVVQLKVYSKDTHSALQIGTIITVKYNKEFYIEEVRFPEMEMGQP